MTYFILGSLNLWWENNHDSFLGEWKNGLRNGFGILSLTDTVAESFKTSKTCSSSTYQGKYYPLSPLWLILFIPLAKLLYYLTNCANKKFQFGAHFNFIGCWLNGRQNGWGRLSTSDGHKIECQGPLISFIFTFLKYDDFIGIMKWTFSGCHI